jgi:arylsulfatase A-like enzyme
MSLERTDMPPANPWALFCFCLPALTLIWLPMAVLKEIDGLIAFMTDRQIVGDAALMVALSALLTFSMVLTAWVIGRVAARLSGSLELGRISAWACVLVPLAGLCVWEFAFITKLWIERTYDLRLNTSAIPYRHLVMLVPVLVGTLIWWRLGTARLIRQLSEPVAGLRLPAIGLTLLAVPVLVWQPPTIIWKMNSEVPRPVAAPGAADIIVLSLDSLAFDDAAICGSGPTPMPNVRRLAEQGSCFTHYYAVSNLTVPTTATMETGLLPWTHWVTQGGRIESSMLEASVSLRLQRAGYATHSISAAPGARPSRHGTYRSYDSVQIPPSLALNTSLAKGLQIFPDSPSLTRFLSGVVSLIGFIDNYRLQYLNPDPPERAYEMTTPLLARRERPIFLWMHTMPPHAPYLPPPSTKYSLLAAGEYDKFSDFVTEKARYAPDRQPFVDKQRLRYREAIMGADEQVGVFLDTLKREKRFDNAVIVVTADHGESFERGALGHGGDVLNQAVLRIPLVIRLPGQTAARTVETPVSQVDLAATLLDLAGAAPQPATEGRSLRPALAGEVLPDLPVFSMVMDAQHRFKPISTGHFTVIDRGLKLVYHRVEERWELYDLAADPRESRNLIAERTQDASRLQALLKARLAGAEAHRQKLFGS